MSEPPPFSPTIALLTAARAWEADLTDALKPLNLTPRRYGLLGHVRATPGISFSELARRSGITVQSVHSAVAGLVTDGLVDDGTAHAGSASTLGVTPDGERLLARAAEVVASIDARLSARHPDLVDGLRAYMRQAFAVG
jgi:DNA-binding MarR family transcriptional regulator